MDHGMHPSPQYAGRNTTTQQREWLAIVTRCFGKDRGPRAPEGNRSSLSSQRPWRALAVPGRGQRSRVIPPDSHTSTLCFIHMLSLTFTLSLKAPSPSPAPMLRAGGVEAGRGQEEWLDELSGTTLQPLRDSWLSARGLLLTAL